MNIRKLKEAIKDLPDDMQIVVEGESGQGDFIIGGICNKTKDGLYQQKPEDTDLSDEYLEKYKKEYENYKEAEQMFLLIYTT